VPFHTAFRESSGQQYAGARFIQIRFLKVSLFGDSCRRLGAVHAAVGGACIWVHLVASAARCFTALMQAIAWLKFFNQVTEDTW
jgi:hypothetical protein